MKGFPDTWTEKHISDYISPYGELDKHTVEENDVKEIKEKIFIELEAKSPF